MNTGTLDGALDVRGPGSSFTNAGLITISTPLVAGLGVQHFIDGTFTQTTTGTLALRVLPDGSARQLRQPASEWSSQISAAR